MISPRMAVLERMGGILETVATRYKASLKPKFIAGQLSMQGRSVDELDVLVQRAVTDPHAFRAACLEAAACVELDADLPGALRAFATRVLRGEQTKPRHHGSYAENDDYRARVIFHLVELATLEGFPPFRNEASEHDNSACDLTAEALAQAGLSPTTYSSVKEIYLGHRGRLNIE